MRLEDPEWAGLDAKAQRLGADRSKIIRWKIQEFIGEPDEVSRAWLAGLASSNGRAPGGGPAAG